MNLVKTGRSIDNFLIGKQAFKDDYIGVLDDVVHSLSIEEAFEMFCTKLVNENNVKIKQVYTWPCSVVDIDDNTYTLAHEKIVKGEKKEKERNNPYVKKSSSTFIRKPSNLLRHLCTRDFRAENIYIDENKNLVDITTNALRDKDRRVLKSQINLPTVVEYDPYTLIKYLYYIVHRGFSIEGDEYNNILNANFRRLHYVNIEDSKQLETMVTKDTSLFYEQLGKSDSIKWYFTCVCKLDFEVKYTGQAKKPGMSSYSFEPIILNNDIWGRNAEEPMPNEIEVQQPNIAPNPLARARRPH